MGRTAGFHHDSRRFGTLLRRCDFLHAALRTHHGRCVGCVAGHLLLFGHSRAAHLRFHQRRLPSRCRQGSGMALLRQDHLRRLNVHIVAVAVPVSGTRPGDAGSASSGGRRTLHGVCSGQYHHGGGPQFLLFGQRKHGRYGHHCRDGEQIQGCESRSDDYVVRHHHYLLLLFRVQRLAESHLRFRLPHPLQHHSRLLCASPAPVGGVQDILAQSCRHRRRDNPSRFRCHSA